jgi:pilus assembly protein CpaC
MIHKKVRCISAVLIILVFSSVALAGVPVEGFVGKETVTCLYNNGKHHCLRLLEVFVGKGTIVTLKEPSKRVFISSPDIADFELISPKEILLFGKKIGGTNLIVWDKQGKTTFFDITVMEYIDTKKLETQINEAAPNDNITVEFAKDTIILSGKAANQQTIDKVVQIAQSYAIGSNTVSSTSRDPSGIVTTTSTTSGKVLNHIIIENAQQVLLEVKVAQIDKTKLKEMGISFLAKGTSAEGFSNLIMAPSSSTTSTGTGGTSTTTTGGSGGIAGTRPGLGSFDPLDPFQLGVSYFKGGIGVVLNALSQKGYGKVLAEPNLVVRSGETGKFHVGTRVPIQTVSGIGGGASVGITYEEVGIRLDFKPEVLETGTIRLKIDPAEVSSIVSFLVFQGLVAPQIDTRTVSTSVDLKEGESLILAGLLSDDMKKNIQKIPLLGDIPILGALFRSSRDELTEKELVFFITPKMVKPTLPGQKTEFPTDKALTPEQEREFNWIPLP